MSITASLSFVLIGLLAGGAGLAGWRSADAVGLFAIALLFTTPVIAVASLVVALPIAKLLVFLRLRGSVIYGLVGIVTGMVTSVLLMALVFSEREGESLIFAALIGALPGLIGGVFWWNAVDRYQDENPWKLAR